MASDIISFELPGQTPKDPKGRVLAYIEDWYGAWYGFVDAIESGAFGNDFEAGKEEWRETEASLERRHFVVDANPGSNGDRSFSPFQPNHNLETELIVDTKVEGDKAVLETRIVEPGFEKFYEYSLEKDGEEWLIRKLRVYFEPEGESLFNPIERLSILSEVQADARLPDLDAEGIAGCVALFDTGKSVEVFEQEGKIEVEELGKLRISSGHIGVYDFRRSGQGFRPLSRSVKPGEYLVQLSKVEETPIACRLIFNEEISAVSYAPAPVLSKDSGLSGREYFVSVEFENLSIFDAEAFMKLESRERERIAEKSVVGEHRRLSKLEVEDRLSGLKGVVDDKMYQGMFERMLTKEYPTLDGPRFAIIDNNEEDEANCFALTINNSDNGYPCYWGLDDTGTQVSLVVDFMVISKYRTERIELTWNSFMIGQKLKHQTLDKYRLEIWVIATEGKLGLRVIGDGFKRACMMSDDMEIIFDTESVKPKRYQEECFYQMKADVMGIESSVLEITLTNEPTG